MQDLGTYGSPIQQVGYVLPQEIGTTSGFHAFDSYFPDSLQREYYDTRSPYTHVDVVLARIGSFMADVCHARNITPGWNIGARIQKIIAERNWLRGYRDNQLTLSYGLNLFSSYQSKEKNYQLFVDCLWMKHRFRETGGVYTEEPWGKGEEQDMLTRNLRNYVDPPLENHDLRKRLHVYQQGALPLECWVYHVCTMQRQGLLVAADRPQPFFYLEEEEEEEEQDRSVVPDTHVVRTLHNTLGVKRECDEWFYTGYYRYRYASFQYESKRPQSVHEDYIGGCVRRKVTGSAWEARGEVLPPQGGYQVKTSVCGKWFGGTLERVRYLPNHWLLSQYPKSKWHKSVAKQAKAYTKVEWRGQQCKPRAAIVQVDRPVYYKGNVCSTERLQEATPQQYPASIHMVSLGTDVALSLGPLHLDGGITWSPAIDREETDAALAMGVDMHWCSVYAGDAYAPSVQRFYRQKDFLVGDYPFIDLFLNFKISSFHGFVKWSHLNQALFPSGCFSTPWYPTQQPAMDIGVQWLFFD